MINDQIHALAHKMKLWGIKESFERRAAQALAEQVPPIDFLRLLLEDEKLHREERQTKRLVTRAKFRSPMDLSDWDHSFDRGISKAMLTTLKELFFYHNRENLLLIGKTGTGKTHLATGLGRRLCEQGISARFLSINLLFEEFRAEKAAGRYLPFIKNLSKVSVLILDDFGLRNFAHEEASYLLDLLEERYQRSSLIVTSQVDPAGWGPLFEDAVTAEAIVDRLSHPAQTVTLTGASYRQKLQAKAKKTSKA